MDTFQCILKLDTGKELDSVTLTTLEKKLLAFDVFVKETLVSRTTVSYQKGIRNIPLKNM